MLAGTLVLALPAAAHPLADRAAAQSTVLTVRRDRLAVDFYADVPDVLVRTARPASQDRDEVLSAMATELASGLLLLVDGETVPMRVRRPSAAPQRSSEHTFGFALHYEAPLPPGGRTIEVVTTNLIDAQNFFAGDVRLDPALVVSDCSLLALRDGRIARDDTLRWTRGEQRRRLTVTLARPRPGWWPILAGLPAEPRRAALALRPLPRDHLRAGVLTPETLAGSVALAVALGASGRADRLRHRAVQAAAAALAGVALAVLPGAAAVEGLSGLGVVGAVILGVRWPGCVAPAAVGALAGASHAPIAAACVALAACAAGLAAPRSAPRARTVAALLVALILLVRAASS